MKYERDESAFREAQRGVGPLLLVAAAVLIVGALLYFGLGESEQPAPEASAPGGTATVVPPVENTTTIGQPQTPQATGQADLAERELSSPRTAIGAGAAPVVTRENAEDEPVVINGELLEGLEAEAQAGRE
jgi:hypothetical protein